MFAYKTRFNKFLNVSIILLFCICSFIITINHEPWRDEAQAWLIARDSHNIIQSIRYETTLGLWHLILYFPAKLGLPYFSMQIIHFFIIFAAGMIFLLKAPFPKLQKVLFMFGYYMLYEYNAIARSYSLVVLLLFLIAYYYKKIFARPVIYCLLLLLLANSNLFGFITAICLSVIYWCEFFIQKKPALTTRHFAALIIFCAGMIVSAYQLAPLPDSSSIGSAVAESHGPLIERLKLTQGSYINLPTAVIGGFLPIPLLRVNFWNSKLLLPSSAPIEVCILLLLLALILIFFTYAFFSRHRKFMLIYGFLSTSLLLPFVLTKYRASRYQGLLFIIFIFSLWLLKQSEGYSKRKVSPKETAGNLFLNRLLTGILLFQFISAGIAVYYELRYPFSAGKETAKFLTQNNFINDSTLVVAFGSVPAVSILPYIQKKDFRFFCPEYNDFCTFTVWNKTRCANNNLKISEVETQIAGIIKKNKYKNVLVIINEKPSADKNFNARFKLISSFSGSIVKPESFYIYKLRRDTL